MKRAIIFLAFFSVSTVACFSQDTTWLSKSYDVVNKDSAASYYVVSKNQIDTQQVTVIEYSINGTIVSERKYNPFTPNRILNGAYRKYTKGKLADERIYIDDKQHGAHKTYREDGALRRIDIYELGKLISKKCYSSNGSDTIWFEHQIPASFPGGTDSLRKFITRNMMYPRSARDEGIEGTVTVTFSVSGDGKIENIKINRSVNILLDKEALRLVSKMPDWIPGKVEGQTETMFYKLPVTFRISDE